MNKYKITIDGNNFDVTVNVTDHNKANVEVNGIAYDVVYESKNVAASTPVTRKTSAPAAPQVQVSAPQAAATSASSIKAPLPGTISAINVKVGDQVKQKRTKNLSAGSHENGKQHRGQQRRQGKNHSRKYRTKRSTGRQINRPGVIYRKIVEHETN